MDTFDLHIDLGNDAMREPLDVAAELRRTAAKIEDGRDEGRILDLNGNSVGTFAFDQPQAEIGTREETELEQAFKAATYNAAKAAIDGSPVGAREWAEAAAKIAIAIDPSMKIAQLELHDGDTLIVHSDQNFTPAHATAIIDQIKERVPEDVRVLFFDRGLALAGIIGGSRVALDERLQLNAERDAERADVDLDDLEPQILLLPEAGQTRCIACGYDASFQPPEQVDCPRCHEPLYSRRAA